jgi:hypothetical protein
MPRPSIGCCTLHLAFTSAPNSSTAAERSKKNSSTTIAPGCQNGDGEQLGMALLDLLDHLVDRGHGLREHEQRGLLL